MKIGNTKLGQSAVPSNLPWKICIYHKYDDDYTDEFYEHVAFEPKAYVEDDELLANSSFGFEFSELSQDLVLPIMFEQYSYDKTTDIHMASFINQYIGNTDMVHSFEIDYINCEDEEIFERLITTRTLNVQDRFKDPDKSRSNSSLCVLKGLQRELPMYGNDNEWNNGLVKNGRKRG